MNNLADVNGIQFFNQDLSCTTPWFIDVLAEKRDELGKYLKEHNIGSRNMYPPINKQLAYNVEGNHPVSNLIGKKGLWLPSSSQLTDDDIQIVTKKIREFYELEWKK
jgi:perosamine synthetase